MVVHNIYIFGRDGACLYYHEWLRPKPVRDGAGSISDDQKMMFGLFFSLKTFAAAMDPKCVPICISNAPSLGIHLHGAMCSACKCPIRDQAPRRLKRVHVVQVQVRCATRGAAAYRGELQLP
jgi:Sybindin-like family